MRIVGILALMVLALIQTANEAGAESLRFAVEGYYPPFSTINAKGELEGFDVDIAAALCDVLDRDCHLVQQDWDKLITGEGLKNGNYDAIVASMSILPSRREIFAFTNKYYTTPARFVSALDQRHDVALVDGQWQGLEGRKIGVQQSTTEDVFLRDNSVKAADVIRYRTLPEAIDDLEAGSLDFVFADGFALQNGFLSRSEGRNYGMVGPSFDDPRWFGEGIGIAVSRTNWELVNELNRGIELLRATGEYDRISAKYFDFDIFGSE